ncbi:M23 family metallopeptidase [Leptospira interrogans serovar Szwajizak]|uniref:M23 family metallopeptidase n=1 Tax=Leptospira interrogans TaxID=173 RepID=UPI00046C8252|nr:M23 family metallopeptidase [Leptospira interrogans]
MKRKTGYILAGFLVMGLFFSIRSFANTNLEEIKLDNQYLQTYRGQEGIWIVPNRVKESIGDLIHNFGTTEHEIKRINGIPDNTRIPLTEPVFFPYNENFIRSLLLEDKGREILRSDQREFIWPISFKHSFVTSRLGRRWNAMHSGVDIACPTGSIVIAAADGMVLESKKDGGYGNKILLSHPGINGINTLYAHNSVLYVKEGDKVKKGQIIALSGNTGHTTGPHLHFEVRYQNVVLNPEHYLPVFQSSSEARVAIARETIEE